MKYPLREALEQLRACELSFREKDKETGMVMLKDAERILEEMEEGMIRWFETKLLTDEKTKNYA